MYELKVLSNEEFDSLPAEETRGSDISNSLGFANRMTGRAYVRQTGIHDLNKYLLSHELEELESDHSTHEDENGIRHKSFGDAMWKLGTTVVPKVAGYGLGTAMGSPQIGSAIGDMVAGGFQRGDATRSGNSSMGIIPPNGRLGSGSMPGGPGFDYAYPTTPSVAGGGSYNRSSAGAGGSLSQSSPYGVSPMQHLLSLQSPQQGIFGNFNPGSGFDIGQSQQSQQQISPDVLERLRGFYSGRVTF